LYCSSDAVEEKLSEANNAMQASPTELVDEVAAAELSESDSVTQ
jgi:hypothetical protein